MKIPYTDIWYDWGGFNTALFYEIYGFEVENLRGLLPYLDFIGEYTHFPYLLFATTLMFVLKYIYRKARGYEVGSYVFRAYGAWLAALIVGFFMMAVIVGGMKEYLSFPRPYTILNEVTLLYGTAMEDDAFKSFPSGHVAFTTLWVTLLWTQVWGVFKPLLMLALIASCWFRMAVGAHFPMDIVFSLLIGASCANFSRSYMRNKFKVWR